MNCNVIFQLCNIIHMCFGVFENCQSSFVKQSSCCKTGQLYYDIPVWVCGKGVCEPGEPLKSKSLLTSLLLRKRVRKSWLLTQLENQNLSDLIVPLQVILQIYFISSYAVLITVELFKIRL